MVWPSFENVLSILVYSNQFRFQIFKYRNKKPNVFKTKHILNTVFEKKIDKILVQIPTPTIQSREIRSLKIYW